MSDALNARWRDMVKAGHEVYVSVEHLHRIDTKKIWLAHKDYDKVKKKSHSAPPHGYDLRMIWRVYAWLYEDRSGKPTVAWVRERSYEYKPDGVRVADVEAAQIPPDTRPPDWVPSALPGSPP